MQFFFTNFSGLKVRAHLHAGPGALKAALAKADAAASSLTSLSLSTDVGDVMLGLLQVTGLMQETGTCCPCT